jgi:uncharacterized membrane protein YidH (DUF202 family)
VGEFRGRRCQRRRVQPSFGRLSQSDAEASSVGYDSLMAPTQSDQVTEDQRPVKREVIQTIVWFIGCMLLMMGVQVILAYYQIGGPMTHQRASLIGQISAVVIVTGLIRIWWSRYLTWQEQIKAQRKKSKDKPKGRSRSRQ